MKKSLFALAAAAVAVAGAAQAQVCAGFPVHDNQGTIAARADFPSGADQFGVEGAFNFTGPLSLNAGYIRTSIHDDVGGGSLDTFRAGAAVDISSYTAGMLPGVSVCPNVRADFTSEDGTNLYEVPVGLGLGLTLPLGSPDMTLTPYAIPAVVFSRFSDPVLGDFNETDFGIRGGADLNFDRFYLGGQVEWVNTTGSDPVFGVRAGIKF